MSFLRRLDESFNRLLLEDEVMETIIIIDVTPGTYDPSAKKMIVGTGRYYTIEVSTEWAYRTGTRDVSVKRTDDGLEDDSVDTSSLFTYLSVQKDSALEPGHLLATGHDENGLSTAPIPDYLPNYKSFPSTYRINALRELIKRVRNCTHNCASRDAKEDCPECMKLEGPAREAGQIIQRPSGHCGFCNGNKDVLLQLEEQLSALHKEKRDKKALESDLKTPWMLFIDWFNAVLSVNGLEIIRDKESGADGFDITPEIAAYDRSKLVPIYGQAAMDMGQWGITCPKCAGKPQPKKCFVCNGKGKVKTGYAEQVAEINADIKRQGLVSLIHVPFSDEEFKELRRQLGAPRRRRRSEDDDDDEAVEGGEEQDIGDWIENNLHRLPVVTALRAKAWARDRDEKKVEEKRKKARADAVLISIVPHLRSSPDKKLDVKRVATKLGVTPEYVIDFLTGREEISRDRLVVENRIVETREDHETTIADNMITLKYVIGDSNGILQPVEYKGEKLSSQYILFNDVLSSTPQHPIPKWMKIEYVGGKGGEGRILVKTMMHQAGIFSGDPKPEVLKHARYNPRTDEIEDTPTGEVIDYKSILQKYKENPETADDALQRAYSDVEQIVRRHFEKPPELEDKIVKFKQAENAYKAAAAQLDKAEDASEAVAITLKLSPNSLPKDVIANAEVALKSARLASVEAQAALDTAEKELREVEARWKTKGVSYARYAKRAAAARKGAAKARATREGYKLEHLKSIIYGGSSAMGRFKYVGLLNIDKRFSQYEVKNGIVRYLAAHNVDIDSVSEEGLISLPSRVLDRAIKYLQRAHDHFYLELAGLCESYARYCNAILMNDEILIKDSSDLIAESESRIMPDPMTLTEDCLQKCIRERAKVALAVDLLKEDTNTYAGILAIKGFNSEEIKNILQSQGLFHTLTRKELKDIRDHKPETMVEAIVRRANHIITHRVDNTPARILESLAKGQQELVSEFICPDIISDDGKLADLSPNHPAMKYKLGPISYSMWREYHRRLQLRSPKPEVPLY